MAKITALMIRAELRRGMKNFRRWVLTVIFLKSYYEAEKRTKTVGNAAVI